MTERQDDNWCQTFTGRQFFPLSPRVEDVCIEDIAHALSMQCRYGGACLQFYSVAEHCVLLSRVVAPEHALWALMHDAAEAYLVDVPRPIKKALAGYAHAESVLLGVIEERFDLGPYPEEVKEADNRILLDERRQNMAPSPASWGEAIESLEPLGVTLQFWPSWWAESEFLRRFDELTRA